MLRRAVIVIPTEEKEVEACDFLYQTARLLAKHNTVLIVQLRDALSVKEWLLQKLSDKTKPRWSTQHRITYFRPLYLIPFRRFRLIESLNRWFSMLAVHLWASLQQAEKKIVWMFFPELQPLLKVFGQQWLVIYDIVDFHTRENPQERAQLTQQKRQLLERADVITAISQTLQKQYKKLTSKKIHLVPPGFWQPTKPKTTNIKGLKKNQPVIGYVGGINSRLDDTLLKSLVINNPQWQFVFVGAIGREPNTEAAEKSSLFKKIQQHSNVIWLDHQPKNTIPSIIKQFDVGIIPYDTSLEFNKYCYPMKLFEYFYQGKPIVSTPIEELKNFPPFVKIGTTPQQWEKHIHHLLKQSTANPKQQKQLAMKNSWENKLAKISEVISAFAKSPAQRQTTQT